MSTRPVLPPSNLPERLLHTPLVDNGGLLTQIWQKFFQTLPFNLKTPALIEDTHASRASILASSYASGSLFHESDRELWYVAVKKVWKYVAGVFHAPQANLPIDLGADDTGLIVHVSDYGHALLWNGSGWEWAPGETGSDFIVAFLSGPNPVIGWQACDGSANVAKLNYNGSVDFVTVPNTAGSWYRQ